MNKSSGKKKNQIPKDLLYVLMKYTGNSFKCCDQQIKKQ